MGACMMLRRIVSGVLAVAAAGFAAAEERAPAGVERAGEAGVAVVVRGTIDSVFPPFGFMLADGTEVDLEPSTEWADTSGVDGLAPGDVVVVTGRQDSASPLRLVKAGGVRVVSGGGRVAPIGAPVCLPPRVAKARAAAVGHQVSGPAAARRTVPEGLAKSAAELEGSVVSISADSFELETAEAVRYTVIIDEETEFKDVAGLEDLEPEDAVRVRGELDDQVLIADRVELRTGDGGNDDGGTSGIGGVDFEAVGVLTELRPPARFALSDDRVYLVDGLTVFEEPIVSYAGLSVGQYLKVKAVYEGGGLYRALEIEYEGEVDGGQGYVRLEGIVETVSPSSLSLTDGSVVLLASTTVYNGDADRPEDVWPGWRAEISALSNDAGNLVARSVRCKDLEPATTAGQEYEPHEAVLILAEGADAETVAERHDARVSGSLSSRSVLLTWESEIDDELLAELEADPEIEAVEPNYLFRDPESVRRRFVIVDRSPTSLEYTGQAAAIKHGVWKALTVADGSGAVVAIIDTGVDHCHPLLVGHLVGGGLDLVDGDLSPWETDNGLDEDGDGEIDEAVGHGTLVASLVALAAPGAKILPYRVLDDDGGGTAFNLAIALADAIDRGVDVINLSLAYRERSVVVDLLLEEAEQRGIVVVAAAGNDGGSTLPFPAIDSHVLAVTALRTDGSGLADFANRGDKAVVAAIGEDVYGGLYAGEYGASSGTSLAAPFAAAGAALAKGRDPGVSAAIVRLLLIQTGLPVVDGAWNGRSLDLGQAMISISN